MVPASRTLQPIAEAFELKSQQTIGRWYRNFHWMLRAQLFDQYNARIAADEAVREHQDMVKRHIAMSMVLQEKAIRALQQLDPARLSPLDIVRFTREAVTIERVSRGAPNDIIQHQEAAHIAEQQGGDPKFTLNVVSILAQAGALPEGVNIERLKELAESSQEHEDVIEGTGVYVDDDIPEAA